MKLYTWRNAPLYGLEILRPDGTQAAYLQGDDATTLRNSIETIEGLWSNEGHATPFKVGPFFCEEEHISAILSDYDNGQEG